MIFARASKGRQGRRAGRARRRRAVDAKLKRIAGQAVTDQVVDMELATRRANSHDLEIPVSPHTGFLILGKPPPFSVVRSTPGQSRV